MKENIIKLNFLRKLPCTSTAKVTLKTKKKEHATLLPQKSKLYQIIHHPVLKPYNCLAVMVMAINVLAFLSLASEFSFINHQISLQHILYFTLANFGVGIFIRQQQIINFLFRVATSAPITWPLSIRWTLGKVYHFGGIHVGGFFSGSVWLIIFAFTSFLQPSQSFIVPSAVKFMSIIHIILLLVMMTVALPVIRNPKHNLFERIARFGGWASLLLFWQHSLLLIQANAEAEGFFRALISAPEIGILVYLTFCVIRPWLHLRKVPVSIVRPSNHVGISEFNYGVTPFPGSSTDLSRNPLLEWHSFANIPSPSKEGFRLCISRAGDWTGQYINDVPSKIWSKGIPVAGVGNIELLFKKVIWIATGSGIGPCIPHLLTQKVPSQLVWSTRAPRKTYGNDLVNEILDVQPEAVIWDTTSKGKPDLVDLAYKAYKEFNAEAVIVISNKKTTFHINHELESRGIPAFGAIWDS